MSTAPTKYVIVIPDGCADEPVASLGNRTPLQAAYLPNMDRIATLGVVGRANNVPASLTPASDVATLSLFGYDPLEVYTGRAPLEAVALGIKLGPFDQAVRCNLVHVDNGEMRDFTAGHITSEDGRPLIEAVQAELGGPVIGGRIEFHPGVSYRNLMVFRGDEGHPPPFDASTRSQPPHDVPDRPIVDHLPIGAGSELLRDLMERSRGVLQDHPVNVRRRSAGQRDASQVWLWGQGRAPVLRPFSEVYGPRGAILSAVDLVRGTGMLVGWDRVDVPGATGYLDTDYAAKGRYAVAALERYDLVCVHIEAPDEASHEGKADEKVKALEEIDRHIVGPLLERLPSYGSWRILVSPDHRTTLSTRAHAYGAVPFAVAGTGIDYRGPTTYDEETAARSELAFEPGHGLMRWFLA